MAPAGGPVDPMTPTALDPSATLPEAERGDAPGEVGGYALRELLGQGGMGEVILAHDATIGRDVALKRIRSQAPSDEYLSRFMREAKIQARLDHPAIVPVYAIGTDDAGHPYFTMKRLTGTTLAALLATGQETQQRLLRGLVDVCLAVQFAHSHHVVHRDLKPSNIMLGDYGEVYVLDWGVARVLSDGGDESRSLDDIPSLGGETSAGSLLGTPGYMAPEQALGEEVGTAADVYALGSILFEILAGEPLHPRGTAAIASTLGSPERSPARRKPDRTIAPELDAACVAALDPEPAKRPSAREVADRLQAYLDGDRDVERRRAHAAGLVTSARAAIDRGHSNEAMRVAGQALIFDPTSEDAFELVRSLLTPPSKLPEELVPVVKETEVKGGRNRSRRALVPYMSFFLLLPGLLFIKVVSWPPLIALNLAVLAILIALSINIRRGLPEAVPLVLHLVVIVAFSRVAGPLILTPILICAILLAATSLPWMIERRWAVIAWTIVASVLPFVLEALGLLSPSWTVDQRGVTSFGTIFDPGQSLNIALTVAGNTFALVIVGLYAVTVSRDRRDAQRRLQIQAWQLEQILPRRSPTAAP